MDSRSNLLTEEAKITKIKSMLPKSDRRGRFFTPDEAFYAPVLDDDGLKSMVKQLSLWVGFKPLGLVVSFSSDITENSQFSIQDGKPVIFIHERHKNNSFACGGLLAEGLLRYYLEYRKHVSLKNNDEQNALILLAVIYSGLGLIGANQTTSYWQQKYPKLYQKVKSKIIAQDITYFESTKQFAAEYGIELGAFARYLCPWAIASLNLPTSLNPTAYARAAHQKVRKSYTALAASMLVIICGLGLGGYIISQQPAHLTIAQRQERESIDILKKSYDLCLTAVIRKQQAYDQSDFFITRNLDADKLRCISIQNLYNARVERYNSQL